MSAKKSVFEPLRVRIRRFQFSVGLGFVALILGSMLSGSLVIRLSQRLAELPGSGLHLVLGVLMEQLWVLAVLPALCYGAARIVDDLRPLPTAVNAALGGQVFVLALNYVREGAPWSSSAGWLVELLRWAAFGVGIYLSYRAVKQGRAATEVRAAELRAKAEAKKSEYDEFLRQAELDGERAAQREAQRAAAATAETATPPVETVPAPVETAPAQAPAPVETPVVETPKASGS